MAEAKKSEREEREVEEGGVGKKWDRYGWGRPEQGKRGDHFKGCE